MRKKQQAAFQSLSATFPTGTIEKWSKMVDDWERDMTKPNPFEESNTSMFLSTFAGMNTCLLQQSYNPPGCSLGACERRCVRA